MAGQSLTENYKQLRAQPMWSLLASDTAPETLAQLQVLLFDNETALAASVFLDRLQALMQEASVATVEREQAVVRANQWRSKGFVTVRYRDGTDEPVYELTAAAHSAVSFVAGQSVKRTSPSESRLELVAHAVKKLAQDTDPDVHGRIERLLREKERIEEKIRDLENGRMTMISDAEVTQQAEDLLEMLETLGGDFLRVRDSFRELADALHAEIMQSPDSRGDVLARFFGGYDRIAESDAGRSFAAFYRFLNNELEMREVDEAVDSLQTRPFWAALPDKSRRSLLFLRSNLNRRARETQFEMKKLSSSLKRFVQSQSFTENKRLAQLLTEAKATAVAVAAGVKSADRVFALDLTTVRVGNISGLCLYDPENDAQPVVILPAGAAEVDMEALAARINASEINYAQLKRQVIETLTVQDEASVGEVLKRHSAQQGLGSVVGLLSLAVRHGVRREKSETVAWENRFGEMRAASVPLFVFTQETRREFEERNASWTTLS